MASIVTVPKLPPRSGFVETVDKDGNPAYEPISGASTSELNELSQLRLAIVELDAQREADKAEIQLAIAEAVAAMMGGEA